MRVLLAFDSFAGFGGTETYTLTVALELIRLGHEASVYSPVHGPMAEHASEQGVPVLGRGGLPADCELLICSDVATCHELAHRYRSAVRVFVAHSADFALQSPPRLRDECQAVVVLNDRVGRTVAARWHDSPVIRLRQPIDLLRFHNLMLRRDEARSALVLSNYVRGVRAEMIARACQEAGLELVSLGGQNTFTARPELAIAQADLVIGLGRSVLEGMAAGRPTYVYGVVGGDGWVTPDTYGAMEADGFAGTSRREKVVDAARLGAELSTWQAPMGEVARDLASAHHSAREHAVALVALAAELDAAPPPAPDVGGELAHLVRLERQAEVRGHALLHEVERLATVLTDSGAREEVLRTELAAAQARAATAERESSALKETRRYRLGCRLAAPLDSLRSWGRRRDARAGGQT